MKITVEQSDEKVYGYCVKVYGCPGIKDGTALDYYPHEEMAQDKRRMLDKMLACAAAICYGDILERCEEQLKLLAKDEPDVVVVPANKRR